MTKRWLVVLFALGLSGVLGGCAGSDDDDDSGPDGDADADADGDSDECQPVEEQAPTCVPDGLDAAPALLEEGCGGLNAHTTTLDAMIADTDARVHRDIAYPRLTVSISAEDPLTFPISSSLQALINGCEIPADPNTNYKWILEGDAMNVVLAAGKYYVIEVRERGAGGEDGARLFYRRALQMPSVLPNIQTPATGEALPEPGRNVTVPVTWTPFDLGEITWAITKSVELQAFIQGGGANQLYPDPNTLPNIDPTTGQATWSSGAFSDWDFIRMKVSLFSDRQEDSISINVVRSVN